MRYSFPPYRRRSGDLGFNAFRQLTIDTTYAFDLSYSRRTQTLQIAEGLQERLAASRTDALNRIEP